jgi:hypothetical protein
VPTPRVEPTTEGDEFFLGLAETLRKVALGLAAMLFVVRAYFPSEDADTGSGLVWDFAVLATTAIGLSSALIGGLKFRWSWTDAAVIALIVLVAKSALDAADRRPAITMAWEWGSLGLLYLMVRNLPRSRNESSTMAGALVATAVAVSAYGLYQIVFEIPFLRALFQSRPDAVMIRMEIEPGTPQAEALKQRILYSTEVFSTFALANSLAGFLVGALALCFALGLENLRRETKGSRLFAYLLALVPGMLMLVCLVLTKSRSAWVGLAVALMVLAWRARKALPRKVLIVTGVGLMVLFGGLIAAGVATKQLDRQVLSQATLSLRYRWEYWVGAWGIITNAPSPYASTSETPLPESREVPEVIGSPNAFWSGVGPANFAIPYLRHKLPEASEEIVDPHNMILEVWASSGVFAMLALLFALGLGLREMFGPSRSAIDDELETSARTPKPSKSGTGWLLAWSALGWIGVWAFGKLNPMAQNDNLARWLVLGLGWALAIVFGSALWKRSPIPAAGLGVGILALAINLLAAGGIGMPSVAMMLWVLLAVGLNLRDDRPCGRLREARAVWPTVGLACVWAALAGTFFGAVTPFWHSEAEREAGDAAMSLKPPAFEAAEQAYLRAIETDHYNVRPFFGLANALYAYWRSPEGASRKEPIWVKVNAAISTGLNPKWRNPNNLKLRRLQARYARLILENLPESAKVIELLTLKSKIVLAHRKIAQIYPTSAMARADLAYSSAEIGMYRDAIHEARQALLLDSLTPHKDKKLPDPVRTSLKKLLPEWEKKSSEPPPAPPDGSGTFKK